METLNMGEKRVSFLFSSSSSPGLPLSHHASLRVPFHLCVDQDHDLLSNRRLSTHYCVWEGGWIVTNEKNNLQQTLPTLPTARESPTWAKIISGPLRVQVTQVDPSLILPSRSLSQITLSRSMKTFRMTGSYSIFPSPNTDASASFL